MGLIHEVIRCRKIPNRMDYQDGPPENCPADLSVAGPGAWLPECLVHYIRLIR